MMGVKIENISYADLSEILVQMGNDMEKLGERYASLVGKEHLVYEILLKVYKRNDKIDFHHGAGMVYKFKCTKGEAWFLVEIYSPRADIQSKAFERLLYKLHKHVV